SVYIISYLRGVEMPKIDRLDRLIRDYVNGNIDKRIEARIEQLTYKSKIDNLGIRTAYSGGSEEEQALLLREKIRDDALILQLEHEKYQVEAWINSSQFKNARNVCEARWRDDLFQFEIEQKYRMSRSAIYREYRGLKEAIYRWSGFNA
ncbi:MAG: RinA family protein, partial [Lactobacillus sp.]|nr:RinA family protein [Lactobacillus sp.]